MSEKYERELHTGPVMASICAVDLRCEDSVYFEGKHHVQCMRSGGHPERFGHWAVVGDSSFQWFDDYGDESFTTTVSPAIDYLGQTLDRHSRSYIAQAIAGGFGVIIFAKGDEDSILLHTEEKGDHSKMVSVPPPDDTAQDNDAPKTVQANRVHDLMFEWWREFNQKNQDYQTSAGNVSENFGVMGQYMKLTDKIHKLRKSMWDAEIVKEAMDQGLSNPRPEVTAPFQFEGTEEILRDIIGHCFLALDFIESQKIEESDL